MVDGDAEFDGVDSLIRQCVQIRSHEHFDLGRSQEAKLLGGLGHEPLFPIVVGLNPDPLLGAPGPYRHPTGSTFRDLR